MRFRFDSISFVLGIVAGTVIWWVINLIRPLFRQMLEAQREKQKERALQSNSDLENVYRKLLYRQTQAAHQAASLFALDEIIIEPRLLAPPATAEPGSTRPHTDIVEDSLPYLPNAPKMGAVYGADTLSLAQALQGGVNLVITGQPGSGKSAALAYLAAKISNRAPELQAFHEKIPFLLHAADLGLPLRDPKKPSDFLNPIAETIAGQAGIFNALKIPGFVEFAFESGRALLLLDGVDELPPTALQEVTDYLRVILRQYPQTRIVTTGNTDYLGSLVSIGFAPLALMPWNKEQQKNFLQKWAQLWQKYIAVEAWAQAAANPLDPILLNRWLETDNFNLTPLEYTLKIWGAYAGDSRGPRISDILETHLRRLLPPETPMEALHTLGAQASLNQLPIFENRRAQEWTKPFEAPPAEAQPTPAEAASAPKKATPAPDAGNIASKLVISGLLAMHGGSRMRFSHPVYQAYLAGKGLANNPSAAEIAQHPAWAGKWASLKYLAAFADITPLVSNLLAAEDPILHRPPLQAARLLPEAPKNAPWRGLVLTRLAQILQNEDLPTPLRADAMAAFALSGDSSAPLLFRQMLKSPSESLQKLAALGAGVIQDAKAVDSLIDTLNHSGLPAQKAACLALVEIGAPPALEAVAIALMRGEEEQRIAAAEALANHPTEGREALREGIHSDDILLRRAIVFGLARTPEPWAKALLEETQTADTQWVVRNAAIELTEISGRGNPHIPKRLSPPSETPWLIEFAGKYGMGVVPGQPATDILLLAIKPDQPEEYRQAALRYLRGNPTEPVLSALYPYLYGNDQMMKTLVYHVLSELGMGGAALPHPKQYGLG